MSSDPIMDSSDRLDPADVIWLSLSAYLVFFMQTGFAFLEGGVIRFKNVQNIMLKNLLDVIFGSIIWWIVGYSFAFGGDHSGFIGGDRYYVGTKIEDKEYYRFMFQWAFACTAATIVSGSVAERMRLSVYTIFSVFVTGWVYSLVVHWAWNSDGWLKQMGYLDFAGSGVVHLAGAASGLMATILLKPRTGRYDKNKQQEFMPNNIGYIVLGTFILWFGWYGFNCGSSGGASGDNYKLIGKIGMHTSLGGFGGGIVCYLLHFFSNRGTNNLYSVPAMCNGVLAGLVAITASCNNIESYQALILGFLGGALYFGLVKLFFYLQIDDPLDAFPMHGGCGILGVLAVGFFDHDTGIFYGHGGHQFGVQLLGVVCIMAWTSGWTFLFLYPFKYFEILRIDTKEEFVGCDLTKHGQYAFILDVDKVRGIEDEDTPEVIADKVRNASRATHDIIKFVLEKRSFERNNLVHKKFNSGDSQSIIEKKNEPLFGKKNQSINEALLNEEITKEEKHDNEIRND